MRQNYIVYNGQYYKAGTTFLVTQTDCISAHRSETEATFLYYYSDSNRVVVKIKNRVCNYPMEMFKSIVIGVTDKIDMISIEAENAKFDVQKPKKFTDELSVEGLFLAWIWYIFIMAIAIIFKDCIGIWILASVVFFSYRSRKLKEVGYK